MIANPTPHEILIAGHLDHGAIDLAATEALRAYGPQIRGYLAMLLGNDTAAGDVFAQFGEDLWKGIARFRRESSFRTWMYKLAYNAAAMYRRDAFRRRVRRIGTGEFSQLEEKLRHSSLMRHDPIAADLLARLRASLTPEEQTMLILRVDRGLAWPEIAQVLAGAGSPVDPATLRKRFERLKERLLKEAEEKGLGTE